MFLYYSIRWLLIIVLGLGIYAQTFRYDFVFDDHLFIVTNPYIKDFEHLSTIWKSFPATRMLGMYSFGLNYHLGRLDPQGYHIFNVMVHFAATAMVWLTAGLLFKTARSISSNTINGCSETLKRELPFVIALLFLVHPAQTQAVTYITQRYESMATVLYLGSVYCYVRARIMTPGGCRVFLFVLAGACALLGIMTKEVAVTIPLMILAVEWIIVSPFKQKKDLSENTSTSQRLPVRLRPYVVMVCAGGAFFVLFMNLLHNDLSVFGQTVASASHDGDVFTFWTYALTQMRVFLTFMRLLVFPAGQNLDHDFPMSTGIINPPSTMLGLTLIGLIIVGIIRFKRSLPLVSFGLAWILVTFSVNLAPRQNVIFEHKIYLISFGFFVAAAALLAVVLKDQKKVFGSLACIIAVLSAAAFYRNQVWQNELTLWEDIYSKSPNKSRVNANLGRVYGAQKRYEEALRHLNRAIELKGDDHISRLNRGLLYHELNRDDAALEDINEAIRIDPHYFPLWTARAMVYMDRQDDAAALADLQEAIRIKPDNPDAYLMRGSLLMRQGRVQEALADLNFVLNISPHEYGALINRGAIHFQQGRLLQAMDDFTGAHNISPSALTYKNIAYCLLAMGRRDEALRNFEHALRLEPNDEASRRIYNDILRAQ